MHSSFIFMFLVQLMHRKHERGKEPFSFVLSWEACSALDIMGIDSLNEIHRTSIETIPSSLPVAPCAIARCVILAYLITKARCGLQASTPTSGTMETQAPISAIYYQKLRAAVSLVWTSIDARRKLDCCLAIVLELVICAVEVERPRLHSYIADKIARGEIDTRNQVISKALRVFTVMLAHCRGALWTRFSQQAKDNLMVKAWLHAMSLSADFHDAQNISDLSSTINQAPSFLRIMDGILLTPLPKLVKLTTFVSHSYTNVGQYGAFLFVATGWIFLLFSRLSDTSASLRESMNASLKAQRLLHDTLDRWYDIHGGCQLAQERDRLNEALKDRSSKDTKMDLQHAINGLLKTIVFFIADVCSTCLISNRIKRGTATIGQLLTQENYWSDLTGHVHYFAEFSTELERNLVDTERFLHLLSLRPTIEDRPGATELFLGGGGIAFKEVTFRHGEQIILDSVDMVIEPGQSVGIVGMSGHGKTTTLKALQRYVDPQSGQVFIDGQDLRGVTVKSIRNAVTCFSQDCKLLGDTIRANVNYYRNTAADQDVRDACEKASVHHDIMKLPDGYNTEVGEKDGKTSLGFKQRMKLARVILNNPKILVLDEPTSAVDPKNESRIVCSLREMKCTRVIVAHRLATVAGLDKIFVLKDGKICEEGRHDELLALDGTYATMWKLQSRSTEVQTVQQQDS
ncbi:hypothetical protein ACJZ2D_016638 [Fusarium nematophilum]